jgi:hypothetical protein
MAFLNIEEYRDYLGLGDVRKLLNDIAFESASKNQ